VLAPTRWLVHQLAKKGTHDTDRRRHSGPALGIPRRALRWYFGTLSQVSVVYGSLTTGIILA
jgi:hypothetical protein